MGFRTLIGKLLRVKQPVVLVDLSPPTRSRSSSQSSYDEPKGDRPWRSLVDRKLKYKPGSGTATRRKAYHNRILLIIFILCVLASIAVGTWYALVISLIKRLSPKTPPTGLQSITKNWQGPSDSLRLLSPWPQDFSRDISPIQLHSHNDYHRKVPLYEALAVGCVGVEADIWVRHDGNRKEVLLVGHSSKSLTAQRTLTNLYLDPLLQILDNQNKLGAYEDSRNKSRPVGVFETHPDESVVLLLDFKSSSADLFPVVLAALEPLRNKGYLTTYTNNILTPGPLTIVASGNAQYSDIISNSTYRDIFLDAPLASISDPKYNTTNSYYASTSLTKAVGHLWGGRFSSNQLQIVKDQIKAASDKGLKDRYWDTISWPIPWRDYVWKTLMNEGTAMLNADDLESAGRWNWDYCVVAGFILCG
ncbi:Altered inheritance of mitochondria protein-like protein [Lachnellula subtilissima]|uniref:Altered inheritance of mitochondria protein 6 n=1 Tax=Lachnellula subtilissima TaxID=602034 RepID=A0A8H8RJR9_9HELO|nr:Altered inheritance of mitochondria protein-like protein [Lachnellula subtilissima]